MICELYDGPQWYLNNGKSGKHHGDRLGPHRVLVTVVRVTVILDARKHEDKLKNKHKIMMKNKTV